MEGCDEDVSAGLRPWQHQHRGGGQAQEEHRARYEIAEDVPERANERLSALRDAGLVVAIDDFGTGYASLGVLRDVPADIVSVSASIGTTLTMKAK